MTDSLRQILSQLPLQFQDVVNRPFSCRLQVITGDHAGGSFAVRIDGPTIEVLNEQLAAPDATVFVNSRDLEDLLRHRVSAIKLVSEGRMRIRGSLPQAARAYVLISRATKVA